MLYLMLTLKSLTKIALYLLCPTWPAQLLLGDILKFRPVELQLHEKNSVLMLLSEFVPEDHVRRARDQLRRLKQTTSKSKYIVEFLSCILTIKDVLAKERFDRFVQGLKKEVRREVLNSQTSKVEGAVGIELCVDSALQLRNDFRTSFGPFGSENDPMEIGNLQRAGQKFETQRCRRAHDLKNNMCVKYHKKDQDPKNASPN